MEEQEKPIHKDYIIINYQLYSVVVTEVTGVYKLHLTQKKR